MNDNRVLVFFLLLLTFSIACIFCLRLSRDSQLTVLITLIAGSISIYAADIYFSFPVDPGLIRKTELKNKGVSNINMQTLAEHISYLRVQGEVTWPRPQGGWLLNQEKTTTLLWRSGEVLIPAGGISKSKTVMCDDHGPMIYYQSDEHGFNNPLGLWKSEGNDAITVGDSFTHGICVDTNETIAGVLRKKLPRTINLGLSDSGPLSHLMQIIEYGSFLKPKRVFWLFFEGNDLGDLEMEKGEEVLLKYLKGDAHQNLILRQSEIDAGLKNIYSSKMQNPTQEDFIPIKQRFLDFLLLRHLRQKFGLAVMRKQLKVFADIDLFKKILISARDVVAGWGGELVFVYLPEWSRNCGRYNSWERYCTQDVGSKRALNNRGQILTLTHSLGIPIVDVLKPFQQYPEPQQLYEYPGIHFNKQGYEFVARELLKSLDKR